MEKGGLLFKGKLVWSLDVIISMLDDPKWREKAERVRSVGELRQILVDFCNANGEVVQVDKDTMWIHAGTQTKGKNRA